MKKFARPLVAAAAALLLTVSACSSDDAGADPSTTGGTTATSSEAAPASSEEAATSEAAPTSEAATDGEGTGAEGAEGAAETEWPRTIEHELGSVTLDAAPQRIVSTSVVLTGSLLAMDAPVIGSGASAPNNTGVDTGLDQDGFFSHWGDIARERGVEPLYQNSELDLEAVIAAEPDLIVISSIGGDSTAEQFEQLNEIAPTVALNYNGLPWQVVTDKLGEITGAEQAAADLITDYETELAELAATVTPPAEPVQMIVFNESNGSSFALPDGPHDNIITALGFELAPLPDSIVADEGRLDFAFPSEEVSVAALTATNLLFVNADDATAEAFKAHAAYSKTPAAGEDGKLVPLGLASFKLDYYSALDMAQHLAQAYQS